MNRKLASDFQSIITEFEQLAKTEPDFDFDLRDEFFDYDGSDDEQEEKYNRKIEQYLEKKMKREENKGRLKLAHEWGGVDHPDLEQTVEQSIIESKIFRFNIPKFEPPI